MFLAPIALFVMLLTILLVLARAESVSAACEQGGVYDHLDSEAWHAELDVALGLDYFSTTVVEEEPYAHIQDEACNVYAITIPVSGEYRRVAA